MFVGRFSVGLILLCILILLGPPRGVRAEFAIRPSPGRVSVALLPFVNYTEDGHAAEIFVSRIEGELARREVEFLSGDELRQVLRRHRIRSSDRIRPADALSIQDATGVEFLLLGSYDLLSRGAVPEVGLSARIVQVPSLRIVRAASSAASGEDFAGLFQIGRVDSVSELAERVVRELFARLDSAIELRKRPDGVGVLTTPIVIVPFDNTSAHRYAGAVVTQILLSRLVAAGYIVLEPGLVHELFVRNRAIPRGEIDYPLLARLVEAFHPEYILTGVVDSFDPARGTSMEASPSLALGARLLQASTGRILLGWEETRDGRDSEVVLGFGRRHSLGRLAEDSVGRLVGRLGDVEQEFLTGGE